MREIFLEALNTSIAASWVVLAVLITRLLLRRAPRNLVCGLWSLVGLRLVIGRSLEASFSLLPSAQTIPPQSLYDAAPVIDSGVSIIDSAVNPIYTEVFRSMPYSSISPLQVWSAISAALWALGILGMLGWALWSWLRIRRQVRESVSTGDRVYLCDRIDSPFIFGFFLPKIYLPSDLGEDARPHVIAHERAHIARNDHLWKPLGFALLTVNWFNPVMWVAYHFLCRDIEMACDEKVVRGMGVDQKKAYSTALLNCSVSHRMIAACPLAFGEGGVKERVKSVLHYKQPAFWVVLITVLLAAALALGFLTTPVSRSPEIRYNGVLYVQEGDAVDFIGDKFQTIAPLESILRDTTAHPEQNGQAVRLDREYEGSQMYLVGNMLYLEEPGGGSWLPFHMKTGNDYLTQVLLEAPLYCVTLQNDSVSISENLTGTERMVLKELLMELASHQMSPYPAYDWTLFHLGTDCDARIFFYLDGSHDRPSYLAHTKEHGWMLIIRDEDYGDSAWTFESEALDSFFSSYRELAACSSQVYGGLEFDTSVNNVHIGYQTYSRDNLCLRVGIPYIVAQWESESITPGLGDKYVAFRCRPQESDDWMNIYYYTQAETFSTSVYQTRDFTLPNGISGTMYYREAPEKWEIIQLHTTGGQLIAVKEDTQNWTDLDHQVALAILGTVTAYKDGQSVMASGNLLGIRLTAEGVTPSGLTLVCQQDGTPWSTIYTGSTWSVARYEDGAWELLEFPEGTSWTMEAILIPRSSSVRWKVDWSWIWDQLPAGQYRIYKNFSGENVFPGEASTFQNTVDQTYYAEFTID